MKNLWHVKLLLQHGADVNVQSGDHGATALIEASLRGDVSIADCLFQHGAEPQVKNSQGHTALSLAKMMGNTNMIRLLENMTPKAQSLFLTEIDFNALHLAHTTRSDLHNTDNPTPFCG